MTDRKDFAEWFWAMVGITALVWAGAMVLFVVVSMVVFVVDGHPMVTDALTRCLFATLAAIVLTVIGFLSYSQPWLFDEGGDVTQQRRGPGRPPDYDDDDR